MESFCRHIFCFVLNLVSSIGNYKKVGKEIDHKREGAFNAVIYLNTTEN